MFSAVAYAKALRQAHATGLLTHAEWAVGENILWSRPPGGGAETQISYNQIAKAAGTARGTVATAIKALRSLGLLTWEKTRIRVLGRVWQWKNRYRLLVPAASESKPRTTDGEQGRKKEARQRGWRPRLSIQAPIRSVAEQLALIAEWGRGPA